MLGTSNFETLNLRWSVTKKKPWNICRIFLVSPYPPGNYIISPPPPFGKGNSSKLFGKAMNASSLESQKNSTFRKVWSLKSTSWKSSWPKNCALELGTSLVSMVTPNGDSDCKGIPPKKIKANSGLGRRENLFGGIRSKPVKTQLNSTLSDHVIKNWT